MRPTPNSTYALNAVAGRGDFGEGPAKKAKWWGLIGSTPGDTRSRTPQGPLKIEKETRRSSMEPPSCRPLGAHRKVHVQGGGQPKFNQAGQEIQARELGGKREKKNNLL